MNNLVSTYKSQGWWKEAEELEEQVMERRKRLIGAEPPSTLTRLIGWQIEKFEIGASADKDPGLFRSVN
jgi:hypothetical protein